MSLRQACMLFALSSSVYYYRARRKPEDAHIRSKLAELAELHSQWGFWLMHHHLRENHYRWNHKRVYRIYTEMGLNLRRKYKKRLPARIKQPLVQPLQANMTWSMDFMSDSMVCGRRFRAFNIIDDYNRESLNITLDTSITGNRVKGELNKLIGWRGTPEKLRVDNGPEFLSEVLRKWCEDHGIELVYIQAGKPSQNGYIERFNRTYRTEVLDNFAFENLQQARMLTLAWMWIYNNERPHSSLGYRSPVKFLESRLGPGDFPTLQKDENVCYKSLVLSVAN